jgi:hypothetical protein
MALTKTNLENIVEGVLPVANGGTGASTGAVSFTSITDSGNLTFTGTGNRITGDFSNGTAANRVFFQTSTTNGNTNIGVLPNGTGNTTNFIAYNTTDPANASRMRIGVNATESFIFSDITGTGTYTPMLLFTGGSERLRIDTSGNVGIGTTSPSTKLHVEQSTTGDAFKVARGGNYLIMGGSGSGTQYVKGYEGVVAFGNAYAGSTIFLVGDTEKGRFDNNGNFYFNSGYGSVATAYGCRAWVNFDGNSPTIRSSGGVSSVTRSSAGTYTVNLSVTMPDANYTVNCTCSANSGNNYMIPIYSTGSGATLNTPTTSSFTLGTWNNNFNAMLDPTYVCVSVFR